MTANDPMGRWRDRTASTIRSLAGDWVTLARFVQVGGGGGADASGVRTTPTEARIPVNVDVIDLREGISRSVREFVPIVRGTLRMGVEPMKSTATPALLRFVAGAFPRLHDTDPCLGDDLAEAMWGFHRRANAILNGVDRTLRPYRLDEPCPQCGLLSMWADPEEWRLGCGMPSCRYVQELGDPLIHISVTPKKSHP